MISFSPEHHHGGEEWEPQVLEYPEGALEVARRDHVDAGTAEKK